MPKTTELTALTTPDLTDLLQVVDDPSGTPILKKITIANLFQTLGIVLPAGTTALAPLGFTSGTNLTTPIVGANEFDGTAYFKTVDVTSGRTQDAATHQYRITANLSTRGGSIADYFDASSAFPTIVNGVYLLEWELYFLKTTAGTVTFTLTNTQSYTNLVAFYETSALAGIGTQAAPLAAGIVTTTTAAAALPVTGSLANTANHYARIRAYAECGTAGNIRLRVTCSAGTITPLRGSAFYARRIFAGNVGTYVA